MTRRSLGHRAPLLWIVLPYAAGLAAMKAVDFAPVAWLLGGAAGLSGFSLWAAWTRRRGWAAALVPALFLAGAASYTLHRARLPAWDHLPPREARLTLAIERVFPSARTGKFSALATVTAADAPLRELIGQRLYCSLRLRSGQATPLRSAHINVVGVIETLPRNPPADTFDGYLAGAGMNFRLTRGVVLSEARAPAAYARFRARAAERFKAILRTGVAAKRPELAGVFCAMMLGEKQELNDEQDALFMQSGTMHLFAISGLHIGVIALSLRALLQLLRLPRLARFAIGIVALWLYVDITGATPSAVRAFLMVTLWETARLARLPENGLSALTASAALVLLIAPMQLFSASFQMSYAILLALLLLGRPLAESWIAAWTPFRSQPEITWSAGQRLIAASWSAIATLLAFGFASTLVSAITGVQFFQLFTPGSLAANMLCIPTASLAIVGGVASLVSGLLGLEAWSALFNHGAVMVLAGIDAAVRTWVRVPGVWFDAHFIAPWCGGVSLAALLATLLLGYSARWRWRRGGWLPPFVITAIALIAFVKFSPAITEAAPVRETPKKRVSPRADLPHVRAMKSAYELAMERLAKSDPTVGTPLTAEQKSRLAEIDRVYQGKFAEREIFLKKQLNDALAAGKADDVAQIQQQLASERARIDEEREAEKERVRRAT